MSFSEPNEQNELGAANHSSAAISATLSPQQTQFPEPAEALPAASTAPATSEQNAKVRSMSRTIALIASIGGGLTLLGLLFLGLLSAFAFESIRGEESSNGLQSGNWESSGSGAHMAVVNDLTGITELHVESNAANFSLRFADVSQARLEVEGVNTHEWSIEVDGDELQVRNSRHFLECVVNCNSNQQVTLTLPAQLAGVLEADIAVSAGKFVAEGDFRDLDLELSAGEIIFEVSTLTLETDVSAGHIEGVVTGEAPQETTIEVSAGTVNLTLPDVPYAVQSEVAAGSLNNLLNTNASAPNSIEVQIAVGGVTLSPAVS